MSLPTWAGAESVYRRLSQAAESIQAGAYAAQRAKDKRKAFRFSPDPTGLAIYDAMGEGNEETCKAWLIRLSLAPLNAK